MAEPRAAAIQARKAASAATAGSDAQGGAAQAPRGAVRSASSPTSSATRIPGRAGEGRAGRGEARQRVPAAERPPGAAATAHARAMPSV